MWQILPESSWGSVEGQSQIDGDILKESETIDDPMRPWGMASLIRIAYNYASMDVDASRVGGV